MKMYENTIRNPNLMQVDDQDSRSPEALHMVCSLQGGRCRCRGGQQKGKAEVVSKPKDRNCFHIKIHFSFPHCFRPPHIHQGFMACVCPSPFQNPCRSPIRSITWQGGVVSVMSSRARGKLPSVSILLCPLELPSR